jgi:hypothetical protein
MSDDESPKKKRADYEVGYGKPPKRTQFRKNESGNVNGRPKGATGAKKSIKKMLNAPNTVKIGDETKTMSTLDLSLTHMNQGVRKGDKTVVAKVVALAQKIEDDEERKSVSGPAQHSAPAPLTSEEEAIVLEYFQKKMLRDAF